MSHFCLIQAQKSSRSSVSGRSSLLSARSSKADELPLSQKRNMLGTLHQSRKRSPGLITLVNLIIGKKYLDI
jgi:hypothetical protein